MSLKQACIFLRGGTKRHVSQNCFMVLQHSLWIHGGVFSFGYLFYFYFFVVLFACLSFVFLVFLLFFFLL